MTGGSTTLLEENNDILLEILFRVNPECIFSCILVSKQWFELITSPSFRKHYLNRWNWKGCDLKFVGFADYNIQHVDHPCESPAPPAFQLVPTSEFGRVINQSKIMSNAGYFIASTPDGLILSGEHPNKYFVCSLTTRLRIELPALPVQYNDVSIAILSHEEDDNEMVFDTTCKKKMMRNFEVIYAKSNYLEEPDDNIMSIQTFSSLTGEWRSSILSCTQYFTLCRGVGTVARGVLYWSARIDGGRTPCFAAYDTKTHVDNDIGHITLINKPSTVHDCGTGKENRCNLGVTSEGFLLFASVPDLRQICIWVLDDNFEDVSVTVDGDSRWRLCYEIDIDSMMMRNSAALSECNIEVELIGTVFMFVAFVPGESDSVFLKCEGHIFIYHRHTQKLERVHCYFDDSVSSSSKRRNRWCGWPHPVTLSGAWPSSSIGCIAEE